LHNILEWFLTRKYATESFYAHLFSASTYRIKGNAGIRLVTKKFCWEFFGFGTGFLLDTVLTLSFKNPCKNISCVYILPLKFILLAHENRVYMHIYITWHVFVLLYWLVCTKSKDNTSSTQARTHTHTHIHTHTHTENRNPFLHPIVSQSIY
jgi:hypothetical protein